MTVAAAVAAAAGTSAGAADALGNPLLFLVEISRRAACNDVNYGNGIQIYEIQQSSDVTYRFWDWGRVGKDGQPRELHTERAVEVSDAERKLNKIEGTTVLCKGGSRTYYISEEHFELCRLNLSGKMPLESGRMLFLTPTAPCTLRWGDEMLELAPFDSVVVPAALEGVVLEGNTKVLMSSLPDQEALRAERGFRAGNVAGL